MNLSDHQLEVAAIITKVGSDLGATREQILSALSAAWIESRFGALDGGDNQTAWGIFQQRPAAGWGSKAQVENPYYATRAFYTGTGGNRGLFDVWNPSKSPGLNAQAVQHSAYPYRYDSAIHFVTGILSQLENFVGQTVGADATISPSLSGSQQKGETVSTPAKTATTETTKPLARVLVLSTGLLLILLALMRLQNA